MRTGIDTDNMHPTCTGAPDGKCLPPPFDGSLLQVTANPCSALVLPPLCAKSANSSPFLFNHFRTFPSRKTRLVPLFSHSCALFCAIEKLNSIRFIRLRTLCKKPPGVGYPLFFWPSSLGGTPIPFRLPRRELPRESARGVPAAPRPPRIPLAAGSRTWRPSSFRRFRRGTTAAFQTCRKHRSRVRKSQREELRSLRCLTRAEILNNAKKRAAYKMTLVLNSRVRQ